MNAGRFSSSKEGDLLKGAQLLDERTRPDFREVYGLHAAHSDTLDAAGSRVRLGGMNLGDRELGVLRKIRPLVREMNALTLASEARSLAMDPLRDGRLGLLASLFGEGHLDVRIAPRAEWSPNFSVFSYSGQSGAPDESGPHSPTLMIDPHWFERPYPHPGPALGVLLTGAPAVQPHKRFEEAWVQGHDIRGPIEWVLSEAAGKSSVLD